MNNYHYLKALGLYFACAKSAESHENIGIMYVGKVVYGGRRYWISVKWLHIKWDIGMKKQMENILKLSYIAVIEERNISRQSLNDYIGTLHLAPSQFCLWPSSDEKLDF